MSICRSYAECNMCVLSVLIPENVLVTNQCMPKLSGFLACENAVAIVHIHSVAPQVFRFEFQQ